MTLEAIMPLCGSIIVRLAACVNCGVVASYSVVGFWHKVKYTLMYSWARADRILVVSALAMQAMWCKM